MFLSTSDRHHTTYSVSSSRYSYSYSVMVFPDMEYSFQDKGNVCLGVLNGTTIGYDSVVIVGGIWWPFFSWQNFDCTILFLRNLFKPVSPISFADVSLRGKLVAYDNDKNEVGWVDFDCTNPRKRSRIPSFLRRALRNQLL
jgi:hypothetical protein